MTVVPIFMVSVRNLASLQLLAFVVLPLLCHSLNWSLQPRKLSAIETRKDAELSKGGEGKRAISS